MSHNLDAELAPRGLAALATRRAAVGGDRVLPATQCLCGQGPVRGLAAAQFTPGQPQPTADQSAGRGSEREPGQLVPQSQRCIRHKERNVLDHLPEHDRATVKRRLRAAWKLTDHATAIDRLQPLASELERTHPGAAASLCEGLQETVTPQRLGIDGQLWRTLSSTNPIESMIEICRRTSRNVEHWSSGDMCLRWTAAGMLEAKRQFRKIIGYKHLARLAVAVERHVTAERATLTMPIATAPAATLATIS